MAHAKNHDYHILPASIWPFLASVAVFVMLFGARIADGCTSGHGLSGVAQLAVGSIVAVAAMFVGGIAAATLVLRRI